MTDGEVMFLWFALSIMMWFIAAAFWGIIAGGVGGLGFWRVFWWWTALGPIGIIIAAITKPQNFKENTLRRRIVLDSIEEAYKDGYKKYKRRRPR